MRYQNQNLYKHAVISILAFFLFLLGSGPSHGQENPPSPLYRESLRETLGEFQAGTRRITRIQTRDRSNLTKSQNKGVMALSTEDKKDDIRSFQFPLRPATTPRNEGRTAQQRQLPTFTGVFPCLPRLPTLLGATCNTTCGLRAGCLISAPTFVGATCNTTCGLRAGCSLGSPTFVGTTCNITCGLRSTCSNNQLCQILAPVISPFARNDGCHRLADAGRKMFIFNMF
ncbi:MAG: hypothetical protein AB1847_04170 [bacterium]